MAGGPAGRPRNLFFIPEERSGKPSVAPCPKKRSEENLRGHLMHFRNAGVQRKRIRERVCRRASISSERNPREWCGTLRVAACWQHSTIKTSSLSWHFESRFSFSTHVRIFVVVMDKTSSSRRSFHFSGITSFICSMIPLLYEPIWKAASEKDSWR